jgi:putative tricarboxylic transport membrane protein
MYAHDRFTFGIHDLSGGIALIPALVGAFGFAEVLTVIKNRPPKVIINAFDTVIPRIQDVTRYWRTIIRSGLIGTGIGIVPGVGEDVAAWSSYAAARRASKEKEKFGKGSVEGLMAAETGDNACVPGSVIPVLTLAVPGSAPAAVLLAAMLIHGVQPGPLIMVNNPQFVYDVVTMMLFASIGILIYGLTLTQLLVKILQVPQTLVMPVVFVLCTVGSFAIASRFFDIYVMLAFGIVGFILRQLNYPMAPLVLGIVLGDLLDKNLRRGLTLSDGDLSPFFTRPISFVMFCLVAGTILMNVPAFTSAAGRLWATATAPLRRRSSDA